MRRENARLTIAFHINGNIRRIYKDGFLDITKLEELPKNMAQLVKQHLK